MDVFGTIAHWAGDAWDGLTSLTGVAGDAAQSLWSYASSIYSGLSWVIKTVISPGYYLIYYQLHLLLSLIQDVRNALDRVAWWVDAYMISPAVALLNIKLIILRGWTAVQLAELRNLVEILHLVEERHTDLLVGQERQARIAAVNAARAYAKALTTQLHQAIEQEAVAGYKAGLGIRTTIVQQLAQDLNARGLLDKVTTDLLVKAIDAVVVIDDPALAAVANRIVSEIIKKAGLGQALGDLISKLITPGAGGAAPKDLTGVIADITHRLGAIEDWITQFMLSGGPEIEEVGKQLKTINSLPVDAALLLFFGQAVTSPVTWASEVSGTLGVLANATLGRIMDLISHV